MSTALEHREDVRGGSGEMFDAIADRYDLLNRIISLGIDQGWRRKTVAALGIQPGDRVLDLATGTADLALLTANSHPGASVVGLDPSRGMLDIGREKVERLNMGSRIELVEGDARDLPFEDATFQGATIAFGIRNVPDRRKGLREMARVLAPGARAAVLELSEPKSGLLGPLARFHIRRVVPWLGSVLSGAREYRYLQQSIAEFPPPEEFASMMREEGFSDVQAHRLTFGVCVLYVGVKS